MSNHLRRVLAGVMSWRGWRAAQRSRQRPESWRVGFDEDIGFTLIALFDGFVIVSAIDLGGPLWLVLAIAVVAVLMGPCGLIALFMRPNQPGGLYTEIRFWISSSSASPATSSTKRAAGVPTILRSASSSCQRDTITSHP